MPKEALIIGLLLVIVAYPADIVYNTVVGTLRFSEAPKWLRGEFLYSHRIQRLVDHRPDPNGPDDWRHDEALLWGMVLNIVDPGHIRMPT